MPISGIEKHRLISVSPLQQEGMNKERSSIEENSILKNTEQYGLWTVNTEVGLNVYFLTQHWQVCDSEITDYL